MPHYRDGTEAKLDDEVVFELGGRMRSGVVSRIQPGSATCNMNVLSAKRVVEYGWDESAKKPVELRTYPGTEMLTCVTAGDAILAEKATPEAIARLFAKKTEAAAPASAP